jgi:hypothetical protein
VVTANRKQYDEAMRIVREELIPLGPKEDDLNRLLYTATVADFKCVFLFFIHLASNNLSFYFSPPRLMLTLRPRKKHCRTLPEFANWVSSSDPNWPDIVNNVVKDVSNLVASVPGLVRPRVRPPKGRLRGIINQW